MATREHIIYTVAAPDSTKRLVSAFNPAGALKHVASEFKVERPSQAELVALVQAGVKVEEAGAEEA